MKKLPPNVNLWPALTLISVDKVLLIDCGLYQIHKIKVQAYKILVGKYIKQKQPAANILFLIRQNERTDENENSKYVDILYNGHGTRHPGPLAR